MTWDDFKNDIDQQLIELGKDGSIELSHVDVLLPELGYYVKVSEDGLLCVHDVEEKLTKEPRQ